jgi:hypothetical protein
MQRSERAAYLSTVDVCAARIGDILLLAAAASWRRRVSSVSTATRRGRNWRGVLARSFKPTVCFASSQDGLQTFSIWRSSSRCNLSR